MKIRDVINAMNAWAPPSLAYDWDNVGLALGHPSGEVSKVLVALTVTAEAFRSARKARAQLIVSHHPLIWEPLKSLSDGDPVARLCLDMARADIACFSAHTNLDVVPAGVNHILAEHLGLRRLRPLLQVPNSGYVKLVTFVPDSHLTQVREAVSAAGAGSIGNYSQCSFTTPGTGTFLPAEAASPHSGIKGRVNQEPELRFETLVPESRTAAVVAALIEAHPYDEVAYDLVELANRDDMVSLGLRGELSSAVTLSTFAQRVRENLEVSYVQVAGDMKAKVKTVAVLGGSGGGSIGSIPADVDVYVTGDVKYHDALLAVDRGICVIDAGHHGTEKAVVPAMAEYLKSTLKGLKVNVYTEPETFTLVNR